MAGFADNFDSSSYNQQVLDLVEALHADRSDEDAWKSQLKTAYEAYEALIVQGGSETASDYQARVEGYRVQISSITDENIRSDVDRIIGGPLDDADNFVSQIVAESKKSGELWPQVLLAGQQGSTSNPEYETQGGPPPETAQTRDVDVYPEGQALADEINKILNNAINGTVDNTGNLLGGHQQAIYNPDGSLKFENGVVETGINPDAMAALLKRNLAEALDSRQITLPGLEISDATYQAKRNTLIENLVEDIVRDAQQHDISIEGGKARFWNYTEQINEAVNQAFDSGILERTSDVGAMALKASDYEKILSDFVIEHASGDPELLVQHFQRQILDGELALPDGMSADDYLDLVRQAAETASLDAAGTGAVFRFDTFGEVMERHLGNRVAVLTPENTDDFVVNSAEKPDLIEYSTKIEGITFSQAGPGQPVVFVDADGNQLFEMSASMTIYKLSGGEGIPAHFNEAGVSENFEEFQQLFGDQVSLQILSEIDEGAEVDDTIIMGYRFTVENGDNLNTFAVTPDSVKELEPDFVSLVRELEIDHTDAPKPDMAPGPVGGAPARTIEQHLSV